MATGDRQPSLEALLSQATDPANEEDRWDCIQSFYQLVSQEDDGPQVAIRLLSHKIQSPQEKEALQALTVLEACMNNCGKRFHSEVAKFRFLNELIKVLMPKYFGLWTPQKVKDRVTEVLYGWTLWLKEEPKIQEAYSMLKKQGIVKKDPTLSEKIIMAPPPERTTQSVFDQEDKAQLLARLLKSARPEDLETANRLIKSTIQEEQEKAEKVSKRESTLNAAASSTRELRELLDQHTDTGTLLELSDDVKSLYERCDRLRPTLFRLASDTTDDDAALTQILAANDELTLVVTAYKELVGRTERNGGRARSKSEERTEANKNVPKSPREIKSYHLIDFSGLDVPQTQGRADAPAFSSLLGGDRDFEFDSLAAPQSQETSKSYCDELAQLNELQVQEGDAGRVLIARGCGESRATSNGTDSWPFRRSQSESPSKPQKWFEEESGSPVKLDESSAPSEILENIFVPLNTIKSSHLEPITVFDQGGIHISLHFAKGSVPGHPGVAVIVVSTVNTSALHVRDYLFQAAVPKTMSLKIQPASGTHLPAYNPLLPPPAISQVLLVANPQKRKVRLRYKLSLTHGDQELNETRDIDNVPDWTALTSH